MEAYKFSVGRYVFVRINHRELKVNHMVVIIFTLMFFLNVAA